jgi:DNA-directed RNA polymerase specialized sigma subunit
LLVGGDRKAVAAGGVEDGAVRCDVEADDLIQIGSVALLDAVETFDPAWQVRLSTHAKGLIQRRVLEAPAAEIVPVVIPDASPTPVPEVRPGN